MTTGNRPWSSLLLNWMPSSKTANGAQSDIRACQPFMGVMVSERHLSFIFNMASTATMSSRPGKLCHISGGKGMRCSSANPASTPTPATKARYWLKCSRVRVRQANTKKNTDNGLKISSDCTSILDAPPVKNTEPRKAARSQN